MPISYKHNAVFVHIPKTGGQAVSHMFGIAKHSRINFYDEGLTHLNIKQLEEHIDMTGKYIFTFVRNPYDRIMSEWSWRMRNRHSVVFNEPTKDKLSFDQYMEVLLERSDKIAYVEWREKAHIMPMSVFVDDRVNVFRHERFEEDCAVLQRMFNLPKSVKKINVGHYNAEHTRRTLDITNALYEMDFKKFGYEMK